MKHGTRSGNVVYHWKHGWIPLDHFAALSKAHHSKSGAAKVMQKHGIDVPKGYKSDHRPTPPADDHITLYHGTHARHVEGIRKDGLKQAMTGSAQSYTLTTSRKQAEGYAAGHGKDAAVLEFKVPKSEIRKIGVDNEAALWNTPTTHNVYGESAQAYALRRTLPAKYVTDVHRPSTPAAADAHSARAAELRAAAAKKRAEADRIAGSVGAPDRAGAMLRAKDSRRMNERMDSGLRRFTEAQRQAKALESKAHLAEGRAKEAARPRLSHEDIKGATHVQDQFGWHEVVRVNAKSVTVKTPYSWTDTIPHEKVHKVLRATPAQIAAAHARAAAKR